GWKDMCGLYCTCIKYIINMRNYTLLTLTLPHTQPTLNLIP
uniref:Uncharacterized protein n=1 Tax=Amphimedon queenslandica TaxID=400682 RepID=A0A1X7UGU3_AMPQE